ncbi:aldo/keto reductase [Maribacter halichondriae]|uniref:aldo/keto reductase n=1 Tax=Maribacter halichondriae TaxID=2980554 RepID=UPI002359D333|nr:aldo/keto reductase [Maribacter sp. Hal144]
MGNIQPFSRIIAGTMTWGQWGKQLSKSDKIELMHHCLEVGITTFDHADIYGGYTNETDFGAAFSESEIIRENIQLISKCGIQYVCDARDNRIKHYEYSKDYIIWSAEESLRNLKMDYLDLFLLHRPSPLMLPEEIATAITQLKKEGKILEFGVSNFTPAQIKMLETIIPVTGNQVEFSLTADKVMYDGTLDDIVANKRLAMSWSPLGAYFGEENESTQRIGRVLETLTKKYSATEDQLLLAWILKHPAEVHPVVGTTDKNRLANAMKATKIEMELQDWFMLLEANQGHKVP